MKTRALLPEAVFARTREPHEIPSQVRLRALEWALYFAVTGRHTAAELGLQMRVEATDRDSALARLRNQGLIAERELDAAEYVRALAASGDQEEKSLREFLMIAAQPPAAVDPGSASEIPHREPPPETLTLTSLAAPPAAHEGWTPPRLGPVAPPSPTATPSRPAIPLPPPGHPSPGTAPTPRPARPAFAFKPLPSPNQEPRESGPTAGKRRLSLRALMNLIERQAGSREAGQLDIYRVFVRVDTLLLKRNGIETLRFTEDRLVADPELEQAIVRSVKKTLGLVCPENVWVDGV